MPERVVRIANEVSELTRAKLGEVAEVATATKMLAINASIEAAHAGTDGAGFAVVAKEVGTVADEVRELSEKLNEELAPLVDQLTSLGTTLVRQVRGSRLADLALNVIDIMDRNLYERSCDVRWWATDAAVVDVCERSTDQAVLDYACHRLEVILGSYTVYLDLAIADTSGRVIAHGRRDRFPGMLGAYVGAETWFQQALATRSGEEYAVADISRAEAMGDTPVATYATAVRRGGEANGEIVGVLGIFFDFEPQARAIVRGVRLSEDEVGRTRVMIVDANRRVLASSDGLGVLSETVDLTDGGGQAQASFQRPDGEIVGYALTPGYETYRGLGWYGVITQRPLAAEHGGGPGTSRGL